MSDIAWPPEFPGGRPEPTESHQYRGFPPRAPRERLMLVLLFGGFVAVYAAFRSQSPSFESVEQARMVEGGLPASSRHWLQYAAVGELWGLVTRWAPEARPLEVAQSLNAFFGAATVTLTYAVLALRTRKLLVSVALAVVFGFTSGVGRTSIEGEAHLGAAFFLMAAWWLLLRPFAGAFRRLQCASAGLALGLAALFDQSYLFLLPALTGYVLASRGHRREWIAFLAACAAPVAIGYAVASSSGGVPQGAFWSWLDADSGSQTSLTHTLTRGLRAVGPLERPGDGVAFEAALPVIGLVVLALWGARRTKASERALHVAWGAQLFSFLFAMVWLRPSSISFVPSLVPLLVLAAHAARSLGHRFEPVLLALAATFTSTGIGMTLSPAADRASNDSRQRAEWVDDRSRSGALILSVGTGRSRNDVQYFPYFASVSATSAWEAFCCSGRPAVVHLEREAGLALRRGRQVLVFGSLVDPAARFHPRMGVDLPAHGAEVRRVLEDRYELRRFGIYEGLGYSEPVYELVGTGRARSSSTR